MRNMEKFKALRNRLKDEYPVAPQRQRGDAIDEPIVVQLPSMREWSGHSVLGPLTAKKTIMTVDDGVAAEHKERAELRIPWDDEARAITPRHAKHINWR